MDKKETKTTASERIARAHVERWRSLASRLFSDGRWSYAGWTGGGPSQGWKLHVAATVLSAAEVYSRARPILRDFDVPYKIPTELGFLEQLNAGFPFSQVGKFLTVYPRTEDEAIALAEALHCATRGMHAPKILYDARYRRNSVVYYRYGAFWRSRKNSSGVIRHPDGKHYPDKRTPGTAIPSWLRDPFSQRPARLRRSDGPIGSELFVFKGKMQRGKGGVYEAVDASLSPARVVVIKEGRRHGETDWTGQDGCARVKHEARVLRALHRAEVPVPEVFREFAQGGNRYLVLKKINGRPLVASNKLQLKRTPWRRAAKILALLEPILSKIHLAGWVWRDCKPIHIFVHRRTLHLIDFEGACRIDEVDLMPWGSPDYVPPIYHGKFSRRPGTLENDYALGVIAFQFGTGEFPSHNSGRRFASYKRTGCPDFLRDRIEALLRFD